MSLSVCLSIRLSVCPSVCLSLSLSLSIRLSVCPSVCLSLSLPLSVRPSVSLCPSICLSVCLSVSLSIRLSVCLSVCLSVSLCPSVCLPVQSPSFVHLSLSVYPTVGLSFIYSICWPESDECFLINSLVSCAVWSIDSTPRLGDIQSPADILPPVEISLTNSRVAMATVDRGVLFHGTRILANVSEVIALAEGKEEDPADNDFFFEPGRLLYHFIEFCNSVHVCTVVTGTPSIVIRRFLIHVPRTSDVARA